MLSDRKSRRWLPSMATPQSVSVRQSSSKEGHYSQDRIEALKVPFPRNLQNIIRLSIYINFHINFL